MKRVLIALALLISTVHVALAPPFWHIAKASIFPKGSGLMIGVSSQAGFYVDPRDAAYGATCAAGTFNVNNSSNDDAPKIQLAVNYGVSAGMAVAIPGPGCKFASQVAASGDGAVLFSFGGAGPYDALLGIHPSLTQPYIYVPDAAATGATNKCIFDSMGYEGVAWKNITVIGQSMFNGVSSPCNSIGIANGRPQAFMTLDHVSISNMAGIGGATDSVCQPTGTLDVPVFQLSITSLKMGHTCFGLYANYSDVFATDIIMGNIWNSCLASPAGGGISLSASNWRCEFTGHFDANPLYRDGVATYVSQPGRMQLSNVTYDHIMGQCIAWDGNNVGGAAWSTFSGSFCRNAVEGGPVSEGGAITSPCNFLFENEAGYIAATNMSAQSFDTHVLYDLCFAGTTNFGITWTQTSGDGPDGGGGWSSAFINGTFPNASSVYAPGWGYKNNDPTAAAGYTVALPTTCGATGTQANVSGFVKVCP